MFHERNYQEHDEELFKISSRSLPHRQKPGREKQRFGDYEVNLAPDSNIMKKTDTGNNQEVMESSDIYILYFFGYKTEFLFLSKQSQRVRSVL